jgi:hypothetical protein
MAVEQATGAWVIHCTITFEPIGIQHSVTPGLLTVAGSGETTGQMGNKYRAMPTFPSIR